MAEDSKKWSSASLRISSELTNPTEITACLKCQPTSTRVKGQRVVPNHPNSYVMPRHSWTLDSGLDESLPLELHIAKLVEMIEEKQTVFKQLLQTCKIDIFCGFGSESGQGGFSLSPELFKRLTLLPIELVLDLYPPSD